MNLVSNAMIGLVFIVAACAQMGDATVTVPPHAGVPGGFPGLPPGPVALTGFEDSAGTGVLPGQIGERTTIGDVPMGTITLQPPPGSLLRAAIAADLAAAGHTVSAGAAAGAPMLEGHLRRFVLATPATALYWDVTIDAALAIRAQSAARTQARDLAALCRERTYAFPANELIARVAAHCVDDLARQVRDDPEIAHALGAP